MTRCRQICALTRMALTAFGVVLGCSLNTALHAQCAVPLDTTTHAQGIAHQVTVDGHPFALWSKSPAQPKGAVLLVHGRTWSGRPDFDLVTECEDLSLMNGLVTAGYAAYALDMRGYGDTPRDKTGWLTPNRAAQDLAGVLSWLNSQQIGGKEKAHLFGWSYGSTMAQLMVQQQPDLAATLTLFGYPVRRGYSKTPADVPEAAPAKPNTRKNAVSDFITPNSISSHAINGFAEVALAADPVRVDWRELEQWKALDGRRVRLPTLLLQGEFDPLAKKRVHKRLFRRLRSTEKQWVVIEGGDHAAFMEAPREFFINTFSNFLDQHSG